MINVKGYSSESFAKVVAAIAKATSTSIDERQLREDLESILTATGRLAATEAERDFAQAAADLEFRNANGRAPANSLELAKAQPIRGSKIAARRAEIYLRLVAASDVDLIAAIAEERRADPIIEAELRAQLGLRTKGNNRPLLELVAEPVDIREAARRMYVFHASQIRAGQPRKGPQETLLSALALIFLRHTGSSAGVDDVPHATKSHFIGFAHAALAPFFDRTEVTRAALSSSWRRIRQR